MTRKPPQTIVVCQLVCETDHINSRPLPTHRDGSQPPASLRSGNKQQAGESPPPHTRPRTVELKLRSQSRGDRVTNRSDGASCSERSNERTEKK